MRVSSIARGQLVGGDDPIEKGGSRIVEVPSVIARLNVFADCFKFQTRRSAYCEGSYSGADVIIDVGTPAGAAPPLYYALVAPPLMVSNSAKGVQPTRALSALISAALIASAITLARASGASRFFLVSMFAVLTPNAISITAVVNPSSLEISSALLLWTASLLLLTDEASKSRPLNRVLVIAAGVAGVLFVSSRALSPLWLALIGGVVAVSSSWSRMTALARRTDVRVAAAAIFAAGLLAVAWIRTEQPLASQSKLGLHRKGWEAIAFAAGHLGFVYRSGVALLGWDYEAPSAVILLWSVVLGSIVLLGLALSSRKVRIAALLLAAVALVVPVLIEASQLDTLGPTWQGRYTLPLIMGVPLLCGLALDRLDRPVSETLRRLTPWLLGTMAVAQFVAFYFTLRRYVVGVNGPVWFPGADDWQPPFPAAVVVGLALVAVTLLYGWLARIASADGPAVDAVVNGVPGMTRSHE
ncbi:MAG: hypothetical protein QOC92_1933 [Acidimicrobiaceae bacterium]